MGLKRFSWLVLGLAAVSVSALVSLAAFAQSKYPERPIQLVIPFAPGGSMGVIGRHWSSRMQALLGTVVIDNRAGGGGTIGAADVARAQPNGYTLLLGNTSTQIINPLAMSGISYDPVKAFVPVTIIANYANGFAVSTAVPARTLGEFVEYARANPGKVSFGSAGTGTLSQLAGEMFKQMTGLRDIVHVPYKGGGPGMVDLLSGVIPMLTPTITGSVLELHRAGKIRILAIGSHTRLKAAPDIPTAIESGMPGLLAESFVALFAPAGTPRAIIEQIAQANQKALADEEFQRVLVKSGFEASPHTSPEQALTLVDADRARLTPVIQAVGLKLK